MLFKGDQESWDRVWNSSPTPYSYAKKNFFVLSENFKHHLYPTQNSLKSSFLGSRSSKNQAFMTKKFSEVKNGEIKLLRIELSYHSALDAYKAIMSSLWIPVNSKHYTFASKILFHVSRYSVNTHPLNRQISSRRREKHTTVVTQHSPTRRQHEARVTES